MKNKIKSITIKQSKTLTLADGLYKGKWGGYVIELEHKNVTYELATEIGVKGINIPVVVVVNNGEVTFSEVKNTENTITAEIESYETLSKDVKYQLGFIDDFHTFDFEFLIETLKSMAVIQLRISQKVIDFVKSTEKE
jgi:hypothetical protein